VAGGWGFWRSLLPTCSLLVVGAFAAWFVANPGHFDVTAKVVSALWGAFLAVIAATGVTMQRSRGLTWVDVYGSPPIQVMVVTFTVVTALSAAVLALRSQEVHGIEVHASGVPTDMPIRVRLVRARDTAIELRGPGGVRERVRHGRYLVVAEAEGLLPDSQSASLGLFAGLFTPVRTVVLARPRRVTGVLALTGTASGSVVQVRPADRDSVLDSALVRGQDTLRFTLPPGRYVVRGRGDGLVPDSIAAEVTARATTLRELSLRRRGPAATGATAPRLGTLVVRTAPAGMEILVNGRPHGARSPATIALPPGDYRVVLRRRRGGSTDLGEPYGHYRERSVSVAAGRAVTLDERFGTPVALAHLRIVPDGSEPAEYFLDTVDDRGRLDLGGTSPGVYLFPGSYTLYKRAAGRVLSKPLTVRGDVTIMF
jgi:hypothetical protein